VVRCVVLRRSTREPGPLRKDDGSMIIESILKRKGSEVRTIGPEATVAETLHCMRHDRIGAVVVSEDQTTIAGIISDRGIMDALADRGVEVFGELVGSVMTRKVFTCSRHDHVSAIMALMTNRRVRHIPVVETDGRLCGIVSIGDVVKHQLDEIQREAETMREYISGSG
jgi:CBS domain-containing protein